MNRVNIRNLQKKLPVDRSLLKNIVAAVCTDEFPRLECQISICLVTDAAIQDLNSRFHNRNTPTDVLAFSLSEWPRVIVADIFISTETAVSQAKVYKTNPRYEMYLYVIHGLLHIAGYNDLRSEDRKIMRRTEKKYLKRLNIK